MHSKINFTDMFVSTYADIVITIINVDISFVLLPM